VTAYLSGGPASAGNRRAGVPPTTPELQQMLDLLFPGTSGVINHSVPPSTHAPAHSFLGLPLRGATRLLLPCGPGTTTAATAASFRQRNEGQHKLAARAARALAAVGLRTGAVQRLLSPPRIDVSLPTDKTVGERRQDSLIAYLSDVLGREVVVGGTVKPRDVHQTQTLHALSPRGEIIGFVKVSWNPLTSALLRNEARALQDWKHVPGQQVRPPAVLHHGVWQGHDVVVTGPLPVPGRNTSSRALPPAVGVTLEIANMGPRLRGPLTESAYWTRSLERITAVREEANRRTPLDPTVDGLLDDLVEYFAAQDDVPLLWGAWHGDWLPWNFVRQPETGELLVWDWEYSTDCVPLGFDLFHFYYGMRFFARGLDAATALRQAANSVEPLLGVLGVPREAYPLLTTLYGFEMLLRRLEISVQNGGVDDDRVFPSMPAALRHDLDESEWARLRPSGGAVSVGNAESNGHRVGARYTSAQIPQPDDADHDSGNGDHSGFLSRTHARGEMPD
jgi:hypothetical protein